jgi:hypothetical protein
MSEFQQYILQVALGLLVTTAFLVWSVTTIRYRVTPTKLKITWLGLLVRWIRLDNIKHISTRADFWTERWPNVLFATGRTLVIRRRRGIWRSCLITPKYPFEFKATLEQARDTLLASRQRTPAPKTDPAGPNPPRPTAGDARSAA